MAQIGHCFHMSTCGNVCHQPIHIQESCFIILIIMEPLALAYIQTNPSFLTSFVTLHDLLFHIFALYLLPPIITYTY